MKIYVCALFLISCAHYSMATGSAPISIPPFTVEASTDINGAELAKTLVARLEHFGLNAQFGSSKLTTSQTLDCHVLTDQILSEGRTAGVGFSRVKIVCQNRGEQFTQILTSGANMKDTLDNRHTLVQSSATEGVENLSVEISKHFISLQERER